MQIHVAYEFLNEKCRQSGRTTWMLNLTLYYPLGLSLYCYIKMYVQFKTHRICSYVLVLVGKIKCILTLLTPNGSPKLVLAWLKLF